MEIKINGTKIKWIILLAAVIAMAFIPTNSEFTVSIKAFIIITVFCIAMFAMELIDSPMIPSLLLMFAYTFISDMNTVMDGWSKEAPWCVISMFILIRVMNKTPLLKRITYHIVLLTGKSYSGICIGLYLTGLILSFLGDNTSTAIIAVAYGIVVALQLENTRGAAGIMLCSYLGICEAGYFIYNPTGAPFIYSLVSSADASLPQNSNYLEWFKNGAVFIPYYIIILVLLIFIFRPKNDYAIKDGEYFKNELANLGPISILEKKIAAVIICMMIYLFASPIHGLPLVYGFIGACILLFLPGINAGDRNDISKIDFSFPCFLVACMAIGNVATQLGIGELIADKLLPYLDTGNLIIYFTAISLIGFILNFFMTPVAVYSTLLVPLTMVTTGISNINDIFPLICSLQVGVLNLLFPYETTNTLLLYSFGVMRMKDFVKGFATKAALSFIWLIVAIAYWKAIGLLI